MCVTSKHPTESKTAGSKKERFRSARTAPQNACVEMERVEDGLSVLAFWVSGEVTDVEFEKRK